MFSFIVNKFFFFKDKWSPIKKKERENIQDMHMS